MPNYSEELDGVFRALADPTRRAIVERLGLGMASTSELASGSAMALPSFLQHLELLERTGIVTSSKVGRIRTYELTPDPLDAVDGWLADQRHFWNRRLDRLAHEEMGFTVGWGLALDQLLAMVNG